MISTDVVHLEHRNVSTLAGELFSIEYLDATADDEDEDEDEQTESTESPDGKLGGAILRCSMCGGSALSDFAMWLWEYISFMRFVVDIDILR